MAEGGEQAIRAIIEQAEPIDDDPMADDDGDGGEPPFDDGSGGGGSEEPLDPEILRRCSRLEQNDTGNGDRFRLWFGNDFLFVRELGWHYWTGTHWQLEGGDQAVVKAAQMVARRIPREAEFISATSWEARAIEAAAGIVDKTDDQLTAPDRKLANAADAAREAIDKRKIARRKFGVSSGNAARIKAMVDQALPHLAVGPEDLDADPMLFNLENGTLRFRRVEDLECPDEASRRFVLEVELLEHTREHFITKIAPLNYQKGAEAPKWQAFMTRFQPNEAIRRFVQVYHGFALTGLLGAQVFLYNYGTGANGKSTFTEAVSRIYGDYAKTLGAESVTGSGQRRGDQATPDFARLPGARYVRVAELPRGEPLKESLVKMLTGGEPMLTRHLNRDFFEFAPVFKAVMSGNDYPSIGGVDHGIWRRIRLVPWTVTIPEAEQRPMAEVLAGFAAEGAGVLNWLIEGLAIWVREGLQSPHDVLMATEAYRDEMDPIGAFITACVRREEGRTVAAREMYLAFKAWCDANAVRAWKETAFGRAFPQKGFKRRDSRVRVYEDVFLEGVPWPEEKPRNPFDEPDGGED